MVRAAYFVPQYAHTGPCCFSNHARVATAAFRVVGCDVSSSRTGAAPEPFPRRRRPERDRFFLAPCGLLAPCDLEGFDAPA
jgi:hypothetical protein